MNDTDVPTSPGPRRPTGWRSRLEPWRRRLQLHRRSVAAVLVAVAVLAGLQSVRPDPPPTTPVLVAARDVAGGTTLSASDVEVREVASDSAPDAPLTSPDQAVGSVLAAPLRAGVPLTDWSLLAPAVAGAYDDRVTTSVRLADPGALWSLEPGVQVEVLATTLDARASTTSVTDDAVVVAVPEQGESAGAVPAAGAAVVLAVEHDVAVTLTTMAVTHRIDLLVTAT